MSFRAEFLAPPAQIVPCNAPFGRNAKAVTLL